MRFIREWVTNPPIPPDSVTHFSLTQPAIPRNSLGITCRAGGGVRILIAASMEGPAISIEMKQVPDDKSLAAVYLKIKPRC